MGVAFIALGRPRLVRYLGLNLMDSILEKAWLLLTLSLIIGRKLSYAIEVG
jgi:hypothetical protein